MDVELMEQHLTGVPWLVVKGERGAALRALGERAKTEIQDLMREMPDVAQMRSRVERNPRTAEQFRAVGEASASSHPKAYSELQDLAKGADVQFEDLLLLALRGDLGWDKRPGCSDLGATDGKSLIWGHNEDGDPALSGRSILLTMQIDGDPRVTSWWYPGFLPGNTFTVSECGLIWGIDALYVLQPPPFPGRAFVARTAQSCQSLDAAVSYLGRQESAGGFAYNFCELGSARLATVESAGGAMAMTMADPTSSPVLWHTNHFRYLADGSEPSSQDSRERGEALASVAFHEVDRDLLLRMLAQEVLPAGVRAKGAPDAATLCTLVVDKRSDLASVVSCDQTVITLPIHDLATGQASQAVETRISN